jgi:translation initiation factor 1A
MLGNGRLEAQCFDGTKRLAHIRGKMRKKVWINQGDIILLSLREYQDEKADVIQKYTADEARNLKAYGELPDTAKINETDTFGPEEDDIDFDFDIDEVWKILFSYCASISVSLTSFYFLPRFKPYTLP